MKDIAHRFPENPILLPKDVVPSKPGLKVICLLNPGVFKFKNKTWLLVRVAESIIQKEGFISFPYTDAEGKTEIKEVSLHDPGLIAHDPRVISYNGSGYLTTLSHLRLFCSDDGIHFDEPEGYSSMNGYSSLENFGIEDCRVTKHENAFWLTYTAVSDNGVGVG